MPRRFAFAAVLTLMLAFAGAAQAAPPTDFWANKHFMNMAHTGGADEAPANTLFAFKTSADRGADVIEMDGYLTKDGEFVITHDLSPNATSNIAQTEFAGMTLDEMTLAELKTLDFAYKFRPGTGHHGFPHDGAPDSDYLYRGMALEGGPTPPAGFTRNDFRIATLEEVLEAMPNMPMTVDMKAPYSNQDMATVAAGKVAEIMNRYPERSEDVMIVSFFQGAIEKFHELAPNHKALGATEEELLDYALFDDPILPTPVALQPPDNYNLPPVVDTVPILKEKAVRDGYAIQVWPQNGSVDGPELWQKMIDQGANGFFTDKVSDLHQYLCDQGIPRPDGTPRCPAQECPVGSTGYAPDNCELTPATLNGFQLSPRKRTLKAGKKTNLKVTLTNAGGAALKVRVNFKSSNSQVKVRRPMTVTVPGLKTITRSIPVRATRKAKRNAVITVRVQNKSRKSVLKVKATKKNKKKKSRR